MCEGSRGALFGIVRFDAAKRTAYRVEDRERAIAHSHRRELSSYATEHEVRAIIFCSYVIIRMEAA